MGRTITHGDQQVAIAELRAALAVVDGPDGRIPSNVNDPREAAAYVREEDVQKAQAKLNEAEANERAAKSIIDDLVASFQQFPVNSEAREAKHAEALHAFKAWMQLQDAKSIALTNHLVIVEALDRRARFR